MLKRINAHEGLKEALLESYMKYIMKSKNEAEDNSKEYKYNI